MSSLIVKSSSIQLLHLALRSLCVSFVLFVCLFSSEIFFDPRYDRCFCTECHAARGDNLYYIRGKPAKDYGIPIGWCRFGLKLVECVVSVYHSSNRPQVSIVYRLINHAGCW